MTWSEDNAAWLARAARWLPRRVEALRLRVWLRSPLAWDAYDGITIEGALQCAMILRETGSTPDDVFHGCDARVELSIPISDVEMHGRRIACASWAIPCVRREESTRKVRKRPEAEHYAMPTVITKGGNFKALDIPVPTLVTPWIDFFVRGDRGLLADLARDVSAIGRARAGGLGAVEAIELTDDPADQSLVYQHRPQRSLPIADDHDAATQYEYGSYAVRETTTRAPYWLRASTALCAVPVTC